MATINLTTKLFENLTDQEAKDLQGWVESVVLRGKIPEERNELIAQWVKIINPQEGALLLVLSTVVPQWVLLSLMAKKDAEFAEVCKLVHMPVESGHQGVMGAVQSLVDALDLATGVPA